jgi:diguanylate cyclase (GGDEF)-like protein/PAS domain S-box-containing protein
VARRTDKSTKDGSLYDEEMTITSLHDSSGEVTHFVAVKQDITRRKRTDERLPLLSQAMENTSEFIGLGDTNSNITFANPAWLRALGYSEQELVGQNFHFILSPNNSANLLGEIDAKTFEGGWKGECLQRRKNGTDLPVLLSTGRLTNREGHFAGVFGIARDITERKAAEQEILFKNTLLEAQAESTIDGILAADEANKIILSNRQFATMWGVPPTMVHAGDDNQLLQYGTNQIENPKQFLERVKYLYDHREENAKDEIRLKDGRTLDRYSSPLIDSAAQYCGRIWYFRDITERIKAEERLQLWSRVLDQSAEGIFVCDPQERILVVNKAFEKLTGFSADEAVSKTPRILQSGRQDRAFYADMWKSVLETGTWSGEMWNRRKNGEFYVEWLSISAVYDHEGAVTHYVGIFSDVTVRKQAEERIVHLANYDALTDLPNRVLLMDRLNQLTKAAQRRKSKVAVVFIDLDRFKEVNDSLGHDAGDLLLQTLAKRLSEAVREEDTVARLGGDEFVLVFQGLHEAREVTLLAQKPLSCLALPVTLNGYELTVTASLGISLYPDDAADGQKMIRNADAAMYQAKGAGRNAFHFYTSDLTDRALGACPSNTKTGFSRTKNQ